MTENVDNLLPYLYVDEDTLNVLSLEKLFKRLHKVLHKREGVVIILSLNMRLNVYLHACVCVCV